MIYTNIIIPVFTYCGTVNLHLSRLSLGKRDQIHEQTVGMITKTNTVKLTPITSLLPGRQNIYHKAATSTYD